MLTAIMPARPRSLTSVAAAVVADGTVALEAVEGRADAAAVAAPGFETFLDGDAGDQQSDDRIEPPGAERGIADQTYEQRAGEVGAEHVLAPLPLRRRRPDLVGEALLGDPEHRHGDQAEDRQSDSDRAHVRVRAV